MISAYRGVWYNEEMPVFFNMSTVMFSSDGLQSCIKHWAYRLNIRAPWRCGKRLTAPHCSETTSQALELVH